AAHVVAKNQAATITAIGSIPLIMTLGNSMLIPIFPAMKQSLKLSQMQVSLTITVFSIAAAIFISVLGYFSDRFSRKVIIVPSLILFVIGGLLAGFGAAAWPHAFDWIIIGRVFRGIVEVVSAQIAMALTADF